MYRPGIEILAVFLILHPAGSRLAVVSDPTALSVVTALRLSDVNNDCTTNVTDLLAIISNWGACL